MAVAHLQGSQLEQHASPALTRFELTVNRRSIPAYAARAPFGAWQSVCHVELARTDVDRGEAERQAVVAGGMRCHSGFSRAYQTRTSRPAWGCPRVPREIELSCKSGTLGNGREGRASSHGGNPGSNPGSGIRSLPGNRSLLIRFGGQLVANLAGGHDSWRPQSASEQPSVRRFLPPLASADRPKASKYGRAGAVVAWNEARAEPSAAGETIGDMRSMSPRDSLMAARPAVGKVAA